MAVVVISTLAEALSVVDVDVDEDCLWGLAGLTWALGCDWLSQ